MTHLHDFDTEACRHRRYKEIVVDQYDPSTALEVQVERFFAAPDTSEISLTFTREDGRCRLVTHRRALSMQLCRLVSQQAKKHGCLVAPLSSKVWQAMNARFFDDATRLRMMRTYQDPKGELNLIFRVKIQKVGKKVRGILVDSRILFLTQDRESILRAGEKGLYRKKHIGSVMAFSRFVEITQFPLAANWTLA